VTGLRMETTLAVWETSRRLRGVLRQPGCLRETLGFADRPRDRGAFIELIGQKAWERLPPPAGPARQIVPYPAPGTLPKQKPNQGGTHTAWSPEVGNDGAGGNPSGVATRRKNTSSFRPCQASSSNPPFDRFTTLHATPATSPTHPGFQSERALRLQAAYHAGLRCSARAREFCKDSSDKQLQSPANLANRSCEPSAHGPGVP
jgi:hypothetical protein